MKESADVWPSSGPVPNPVAVDGTDERIRLIRVRSKFITACFELPHHHFAVDEVFGTTQTNESDFFHKLINRQMETANRKQNHCLVEPCPLS